MMTPRAARAQSEDAGWLDGQDAEMAAQRAPNMSTELLDPGALSRFHLTTRGTPSVPGDAFSDDTRWTIMPAAYFGIRRGLSLNGALPFGVNAPHPGENNFITGNLRVGVSGGGYVRLKEPAAGETAPRLGLGGALDIYAPTAHGTGNASCIQSLGICDAVGTVRNLHAYEPELFADDTMFFRARFHVDLTVSIFAAELELAMSPGFTIESNSQFLLLMGWTGRVSLKAGPHFDPYLEIGSALHLAGRSQDVRLNPDRSIASITGLDLSTPAMLTLGLRTHFASFDPALFVSIDTRDSLVIFGLDLAGALRRGPTRRDDAADFLEGAEAGGDPWD